MKRLGLVGVGAWSKRYIEAVARRVDSRIIAFARASARDDVAIEGARQYRHHGELLELASSGQLDALLVATEPASQAEIALAALRAGVPAFVEKPLGSNAAAVAPLLEAARARPSLVVVDYVHLFAPAFVALQKRVVPASIARIEARGHNRGPFRKSSPLYDYGTHDMAMCLALLGGEASVEVARAQRVVPAWGPPGELFEAQLRSAQCELSVVVGNGAEAKARWLRVTLHDGRTLVYDDLQSHPHKLTDGDEVVRVETTPPLDAALDFFLTRIGSADSSSHVAASLDFSHRVASALDHIDVAARQQPSGDGRKEN
ncbi:MAG: Gfo/Idh/MocA family oxidoreductase [Polyangiaceae bacterium]